MTLLADQPKVSAIWLAPAVQGAWQESDTVVALLPHPLSASRKAEAFPRFGYQAIALEFGRHVRSRVFRFGES